MKCVECGKETDNPQFCSQSCFGLYNSRKNHNLIHPEKKKRPSCLNCGKEVSRPKNLYCSNACQAEYQYKEYIDKWKHGQETGIKGEYGISKHIVRYLNEKYAGKCARCGWHEVNPYTGNIPLEVEHIDGDYQNNSEDNLTLQCPNCHALTATYKGANRGNGRTARKKYYEKKTE